MNGRTGAARYHHRTRSVITLALYLSRRFLTYAVGEDLQRCIEPGGDERVGDGAGGRAARGSRRTKQQRAPGLDGVRALAVLAVMAFHEGMPGVPGGFLGVDVFFVLSGYLITDLLVAQRARRGRLDLRGFWARRARRLLPALAVVLVTVTAAVAVIEPGAAGRAPPRPGRGRHVLEQLVRRRCTTSRTSRRSGRRRRCSTCGHWPSRSSSTWSWPLILGLVLLVPRPGGSGPASPGSARPPRPCSWPFIYTPGADPSRVYYGTDTHATALLVGSALALTWPLRRLRTADRETRRGWPIALGWPGSALLGWAMGHYRGDDRALPPEPGFSN